MPDAFSPSFEARDPVYNRLVALFNSSYAAAILLPKFADAGPLAFDFTSTSPNFRFGQYDLQELIRSSSIKFPLMTIYTSQGASTNMIKSQTFSGLVQVGIDVFVSHPQTRSPFNPEVLGDALEAVIYQVISTPTGQGYWGCNAVFNGKMTFLRSALAFGAENWLRKYSFQMQIQVNGVS